MIAIVLAIYNGENFLTEQLQSIIQQENKKWSLYIRDDYSNDNSIAIIKDLSKQDDRIYLTTGINKNLGVKNNFSSLISLDVLTPHCYIALSDQDDVWQSEKIKLQQKFMDSLEQNNPNTPLLIHSDMQVVDANLQQIHPSFMIYQGIRHEAQNPLHVLLAQNFVTGCTMMINRPLLDIALPIPKEALLHDWWLALCAAVFGEIAYIDEPLVKYRQHGNNEVGAKHISNLINPCKNNWYKHWKSGQDNLAKSMQQAKALAQRIKERDSDNIHLHLVESYASLLEEPRSKRIVKLNKLGIHAQSTLRHSLLLARLLALPKA